MASWEDTVLSFNPVTFWRLDHLPGDTVMTDKSGFDRHGELYADDQSDFGMASPIETDPSSLAMRGRAGRIPEGDVPDLGGNHTWIAWAYNDGSGAKAIIGRNNEWSFSNSNIMGFSAANTAATRISSESHSYSATLTASGLPIGWFMLARTRNDTVCRFYVNAVLVFEVTNVPSGTLAPYTRGSHWTVGNSNGPATLFYKSAGVDEAILFDYALSDADIRVIYESAKLQLPLSATINVRVVVELDTDQVVPVDFAFAHNWTDAISGQERSIIERIAYQTNINQSEPDYRQRINARPHHPKREFEYAITPTTPEARAHLHGLLWTPSQVYRLPIWTDWGALTSPANPSDSILTLDTTLREYGTQSQVVAFSDVYDPSTAQHFRIDAVSDTDLTVQPSVAALLPAGSPAAPSRLAVLTERDLRVESHTADKETHLLRFEILATELGDRRLTTYTPTSTYRSIEVFSLDRARVELLEPTPYLIHQRVAGTRNLTGNDYTRGVDTGSAQTIPVRVLLETRAAKAQFLGWMDARQGAQNPVWIVSGENDLTLTSTESGKINVRAGYVLRYKRHLARRDIQILYTDGTVTNARITAAVNEGATDELTLDAGPNLVKTIKRISFLKLCTAPDEFELRYHRNGQDFIVECAFEFRELLTTP